MFFTISRLTLMIFSNRTVKPVQFLQDINWNFLICCIICAPTTTALTHISLNVALICRRIGKWLKVDAATLDTLTLCGLLHDIGKLKIPDEILNKPDKYTDEEFDLVKRHTKFGYELLKTLNN